MSELRNEIERIVKEESGRIVATLLGVRKDFELAEDAIQEAIARKKRDSAPAVVFSKTIRIEIRS